MHTIMYSKRNYRQNLIKFMRITDPDWDIPEGYHVHHIVPRSVAKALGWSLTQINHPSNLIKESNELLRSIYNHIN